MKDVPGLKYASDQTCSMLTSTAMPPRGQSMWLTNCDGRVVGWVNGWPYCVMHHRKVMKMVDSARA